MAGNIGMADDRGYQAKLVANGDLYRQGLEFIVDCRRRIESSDTADPLFSIRLGGSN
jgi:hypothetical protein